MSITSWRIVKAKYAGPAFDGEGGRRFGGRWNSRGTPMVYTAGSQALAALEMLVHLEASDLLKRYRLIPITFDDAMMRVLDMRLLPTKWRRRPTAASVRAIGDEWIRSNQSVALQVPSVVVPDESNYLLNIRHPKFGEAIIGKPQVYRLDPRLR